MTKSACSAFAGVGECSAACKSGFGGAPSATCNAAGQWSAWNGTCAPAPSEGAAAEAAREGGRVICFARSRSSAPSCRRPSTLSLRWHRISPAPRARARGSAPSLSLLLPAGPLLISPGALRPRLFPPLPTPPPPLPSGCAIQIRPFDNGEPEGDALALGEVQLFDSAGQPVPITIALSSERAGYPAANCADGDPQTQCETSPYFPSRRALTAAFNCAQYPARIAVANRQGDPLLRAAITSYVVDVIYKGAVKATFPAAADAQDSYSYFAREMDGAARCRRAPGPHQLPATPPAGGARRARAIRGGAVSKKKARAARKGRRRGSRRPPVSDSPHHRCIPCTSPTPLPSPSPLPTACLLALQPPLPANAVPVVAEDCDGIEAGVACRTACKLGFTGAPAITCGNGTWQGGWSGACPPGRSERGSLGCVVKGARLPCLQHSTLARRLSPSLHFA